MFQKKGGKNAPKAFYQLNFATQNVYLGNGDEQNRNFHFENLKTKNHCHT